MNKVQQRQVGRLRRINDFFAERAQDFAEGSRTKSILADLQGVLEEVETQGANTGRSSVKATGINKKALLNDLREELVGIERTARAIEKRNADFAGKFVLPDKRKKDDLAGAARGILEEAAQVKDEFLAYEMQPDFLEQLQQKLEAYEATQAPPVATDGRRRRASASGETIERGLELASELEVIIGNKYRNDEEAKAAWAVANRASEAPRGRGRGGRTKAAAATTGAKPGRKPRTPKAPPAEGKRGPGRPRKQAVAAEA